MALRMIFPASRGGPEEEVLGRIGDNRTGSAGRLEAVPHVGMEAFAGAEGWKNDYLLAQLAHILLELVDWWRALRMVRTYLGAVRRFIARFAQDMRTLMPSAEDSIGPAFQLRLDSN